MYVYLIYEKHIKRFQDVELQNYVEPQVDGVSMELTDPSVWFKVQFLDSILVDCSNKEVYWTKDTVVEATDIHWTKDEDLVVENVLPFYEKQSKIFDNGCHDFDVHVDELFTEARLIVEDSTESTEEDKETILKQHMLRILHVFILPKLILRRNDLKELTCSLTVAEGNQKKMKDKIANEEKQRNSIDQSLEEQRNRLLTSQDFSDERYVSSCNNEFLKEFLKHLQRDVLYANEKLLELNDEMAPLRNSKTEKDIKRLNVLNEKTESTFSLLTNTVIAKETIDCVISRRIDDQEKIVNSRDTAFHPGHMIYMETVCRFQKFSDDIKKHTDTLYRLTSLKDTIVHCLWEIEENGESYGKSVLKSKGESENWSSLSKKVEDLIKAKPLGFKTKHQQFCRKIISKCQKFFGGSKVPPSCGFGSKENDMKKNFRKTILHEYGNRSNAATEAIGKEVVKHTWAMAEVLLEEIFARPASEVNQCLLENTYICYESQVSKELMPILHQLYENCYKEPCERLFRWMDQKKLSKDLIEKVNGLPKFAEDVLEPSVEVSLSFVDIVCNQIFQTFKTLVKSETETMSVFTKLSTLFEIVQYVEKTATEIGSHSVCTDDILDVLVLSLQRLDSETFLKLYAHINLMIHLCPEFVERSGQEYVLISFFGAYQHLFDQQVLGKLSNKNVEVHAKIS